ncbi:amidase signature domain-containing protein [Diaporthe sp. PMI_573]|nr:amidase signature domain-containing protein [Diaporthaceae sp. PMI_573]
MSSLCPEPKFDVLATTADQLRERLDEGSINSVQIVELYLHQIQRHNTQGAKCRAVISTPPRIQLISWAASLDQERQQGRLRGPLHGIPILLKDIFATDVSLGMPTTAGSYALFDACSSGNCDVVNNLIKSGLIIMGKTNMTTPQGSSTGSAVSVACGFAPVALGHETTGSLVSPSAVAGLYALKLTPGSTSLRGVLSLTPFFDTVGAMGKSALDVALACDALSGRKETTPSLASQVASANLSEMAIGFLDIEKWRLPAEAQNSDPAYYAETAEEYWLAKQSLQSNGAKVIDIDIEEPGNVTVGDTNIGELMYTIINQEAKSGIDRFLQFFEYSKVRTLNDLVIFNDEHADVEFDKGPLIEASRPGEDQTARLESCKKWAATEGIDKAVSQHGVDMVVCSSDSFFAAISVAASYPMSTMPLGYVSSSGRPYGLQAIAQANAEGKLVKLMAAWESIRPSRRVPDLEACEKARATW